MNKYGNTKSFIIKFGSGHFSGREVRGKSSSVTTHRIPRNVNAMFYEFAIIQCLISQLYIKTGLGTIHVRASDGNGESINGYKGKGSSSTHPPLLLQRKPAECHSDHISLADHSLKSRHISHEQRLNLRKQQRYLYILFIDR